MKNLNVLQGKKLLNLRGVKELPKGKSVKDVYYSTGGDPSLEEMVEVNNLCAEYYRIELEKTQEVLEKQIIRNKSLQERDEWLSCLEQAGVDNWDGYSFAIDIKEGNI